MSSQAIGLAHETTFQLGNLTVEPPVCLVRTPGGDEIKLEPKVMQVLVTFADAKGALLSRTDLRDACWNGRVTSDDAIDRVIAQIRRLASSAADGSFSLETIPKVGYRLIELRSGKTENQVATAAYDRRFIISGTIGVLAAAAASVGLYRAGGRKNLPPREGPMTIAVLPFASEAPSAQLANFAAALSDEVRSDLSRVVDIRVIAQTSSRRVADEGKTAQQIGSSLGADYLVEGQIGGSNAEVVSRVALVDANTGSEVWTAQESAPAADPTGLRTAVAADVIQHLAGIIPISRQQLTPVQRPDPEAYAMVQQANRLLDEVRTNQMRGKSRDALSLGDKAEQLAKRALAVDPNYSGALAILATLTRNGWTSQFAQEHLTTKQRVQASIAIVRRALLADPRDPAALTALGDYYRRYEFRWTEAENLFRRALSIDPSFLEAHWSYGYELGTLGRGVEGLDHALSVVELDPRNPFRRIALPRLLYLVGDRTAAMRRYDVELAEQSDNLFLLRELYFMLLTEGNATDLQKLGQKMAGGQSSPERSALLDRINAGRLALQGRPEQLRAMINAEVGSFDSGEAALNATPQGRARDDMPFIFAIEYAWAGLPEQSIDMLERALAAKSLYWPASLPYGVAPFPANVRNNPRYRALWSRDPGVIQLIERRRAALESGQMAGFDDKGRKLVPHLPMTLVRRVQAALRA